MYLAANPNAKVVATTTAITDRSDFIIASSKALNEPGQGRRAWLTTSAGWQVLHLPADAPGPRHQDDLHRSVPPSPARAATVAKEVGIPSFIPLPGDVAAAQQKLADLFQSNGEIPTKVDVAAEFDSRFNAIVQKAQGSMTSLQETFHAPAAATHPPRQLRTYASSSRPPVWSSSR